MSTRIVTLFGEEVVTPPPRPVAKKQQEKEDDIHPAATPEPEVGAAVAVPVEELTIVSQPPQVKEVVKKVAKVRREVTDDAALPPVPADVITEDWKGDKAYYTIGEVAGFFKVKTSHIRFWTNEFKLKVRTTRKGDRLYTPDQVRELRAIYHLVKERGFTLTGAKAKLKSQNKRDVVTVDLKTALTQFRSKLVILREQLS